MLVKKKIELSSSLSFDPFFQAVYLILNYWSYLAPFFFKFYLFIFLILIM